jgi:hypothetical protein
MFMVAKEANNLVPMMMMMTPVSWSVSILLWNITNINEKGMKTGIEGLWKC